MSNCPVQHHGMSKAKGCSHAQLGNFGKLFPKLNGLAVSEEQAAALGGPGSPMDDQDNSSGDSKIPAGYTFFAQFIDHDITLDTTSDIESNPLSNRAIEALPNLRTPTLDLDCVYGFGPEANPHLYEGPTAPGRLLVGNSGNPNDLARSENGTALIGDPRNDENIFVSQMQLLFIRFHNKIYDSLVSSVSPENRFEEAQEITRHHYQYLVVNDLLARICDTKIFNFAMEKPGFPLIYKADKHHNLPMPVEFSVAAFRFGHTTVRSRYAVNSRHPEVDLFDERFGTEGFTSLPTDLVVDWRFLLEVDKCIPPLFTKAFDIQFPSELINMPDNIVGRDASDNLRSLAFRNLLRGNALSLPSGQSVVNALKAAGYPISTNFAALKLDDVIPHCVSELVKATPLFFYLMQEAGTLGNGQKLGPAGSAILLEVIVGALKHCGTSFLSNKSWKPLACVAGRGGKFELADVVRYVQS
ncbi:MAG: hypothetical protein COC09_01150 [Gammaproteobacteria bacterium]|nr:MAG: hypothetical protein COC09_01150 [Gammaproteobacteria bacterium]